MSMIGRTNSTSHCERIRVKTAAGRVYDLGRPDSIFFKLRLAFYRWRRGLNHG